MSNHDTNFNDLERSAMVMATAFLKGRMNRVDTLEWALSLTSADSIKRLAVSEALASPEGRAIKKDFREAWRLLEESWETDQDSISAELEIHRIKANVQAGDRSGLLVEKIKRLVNPRLKVERRSTSDQQLRRRNALKPVRDLIYSRLTSHDLVDLKDLGLEAVNDAVFLCDLANALDSSVLLGLSIARRIGWKGDGNLMRLGRLHRVEYTAGSSGFRPSDIDEHHSGIAPPVKLLLAVVARLVDLDAGRATLIANHWRLRADPIHIRLWASLAKTPGLIGADEIGSWLLSLSDAEFWNFGQFPEVAELRARSFLSLSSESQSGIIRRIRRGPLKSWSPSPLSATELNSQRLQRSLIELKRLEIAGALLPSTSLQWMQANLSAFPDLQQMHAIDYGFSRAGHAFWGKATPNDQFDTLSGENRLSALEMALGQDQGHWDGNPAERAREWVYLEGSPAKVLADLESVPHLINSFPRVWNAFGWAHQSGFRQAKVSEHPREEGQRVIKLLLALGQEAAYQAIDGLSHWLSEWQIVVTQSKHQHQIWTKYWTISVDSTNASAGWAGTQSANLNETISSNSDEPDDLDTLNTPAGKLTGVFLGKCPTVAAGSARPLRMSKLLKLMFISLLTAPGKAGLVARHRLTNHLDYFLTVAPTLSKKHLVTPLRRDDAEAIALWRSIARSFHTARNLKSIGSQIVTRVTDLKLGRESRTSLLNSLVVEALNAELEKREAVVAISRIQQALRSVEDEVRAGVAGVLEDYVRGMFSNDNTIASHSAEEIFRSAIRPFLLTVWPKEHSIATPGSSAAFARLPASVGGAFSEAVDAIQRLLVPFDCWSLHEYGFGFDDQDRVSSIITDAPQNPAAFLKLLNCTIGDADDAVIPHDLAEALDQVSKVAPGLTSTSEFRRLATLARRR